MTSFSDIPLEIIEKIAYEHHNSLNGLLRVYRPLLELMEKPGMKRLFSDRVTVINRKGNRTVAGRLHAFGQPAYRRIRFSRSTGISIWIKWYANVTEMTDLRRL